MWHRNSRGLAALVIAAAMAVVVAVNDGHGVAPHSGAAEAAEIGPPALWEPAAQPATPCDALTPKILKGGFNDPQLTLTDADLMGGSGNRVCVFYDPLWEVYGVYTQRLRSLDEFRELKAQVLPLLADAGIEPCSIAFFNAGTGRPTLNDWHDVGRVCEPELIAHGARGQERIDEVRSLLATTMARTHEMFGVSLTWPLRVHIYDDSRSYIEGVRVDVGAGSAESMARRTAGMAITQPDRITAIVLDLSGFPTSGDLMKLVAHEYHHVTQELYLGTANNLPYFITEGGADYFAGLIVGHDHPAISARFQRAVDDQRANRHTPLSRLIRGSHVNTAPYTRGYAALRLLEQRYGAHIFFEMYSQNIGGTTDTFLLNLSRLTGMTLDEFDRELNTWLNTFPSDVKPPTPVPTRSPAPARMPAPARTPTPVPGPPVPL